MHHHRVTIKSNQHTVINETKKWALNVQLIKFNHFGPSQSLASGTNPSMQVVIGSEARHDRRAIKRETIVGHRPVIVNREVIGSKGGWKLSTIFLSCKVFHDWSIIKLGNILYLLDGYIFAVLFETTSHCFC